MYLLLHLEHFVTYIPAMVYFIELNYLKQYTDH
jgi:hypothetical protein